MCYCQSAVPLPVGDMTELAGILSAHGWTMVTAVCTALFSLNHFPCATTLATIRKETGSLFWTVIAFLFPTAIGVILCAGVQFFFGAWKKTESFDSVFLRKLGFSGRNTC